MAGLTSSDKRWELYRILGEPQRLKLLGLASEEELAIGELAEILGESQPNVSRHLTPLRKLGLLTVRRQGRRVLVRLSDHSAADPVIADALASGRAICESAGLLSRVPGVIDRRQLATRQFFAGGPSHPDPWELPAELPAYLAALGPLLPRRGLAVDVGTGDGRLLEVLAPLFGRVVAVEREPARMDRAQRRMRRRGHANVQWLAGDLTDPELRAAIRRVGAADAVFAALVLHHIPRPADAVAHLAELTAPGGSVVILDYAPHQDERMHTEQADLWLGFGEEELKHHALQAGLTGARITAIPPAFHGAGPDSHLTWQIFSARRIDVAPDNEHSGERDG